MTASVSAAKGISCPSLPPTLPFCLSLWMTLSYAAATYRDPPPRAQVGMAQQRQMGMANRITQLSRTRTVEGY